VGCCKHLVVPPVRRQASSFRSHSFAEIATAFRRNAGVVWQALQDRAHLHGRGRPHGARGADGTMSSRDCREQADRFAALALKGGNSVRRATILMAIADSWTRLAGQLDRLEALEAD
jgi:hypothetical protein